MVVIAKGSTNRYVAEEILGRRLGDHPFAWGLVAPSGIRRREDIPEIVLVDGKTSRMAIDEAVASMSSGDIFIKGGNALHYPSRTVGVLSTSPIGGTIGLAYPRIMGSRIRLLIPIGLEKCVPYPIEDCCALLNSPEERDASLATMYPVKGDVFTEIEALEVLAGVRASHVCSGGVAGFEGAVRLAFKTSPEQTDTVMALESSLRDEPSYEP